ncbi:beta-taxilin isoform X2 [Nematolebias whitei]|uniref:beta-taxilin isoform X2 n=1 Tax=Nematolebias whitei TaxID=451745 RepID=UPI001896C6AE|nr:beta-taxilin isoform X2 [Nematolebias whitei]
METSVKAAELLVPPRTDEAPPLEGGAAAACSSPSACSDTMQEFSRRLEDIIRTHSSDSMLDRLSTADLELKEEVKGHVVAVETDVRLIKQNLKASSSPEENLEELIRKHADLVALRRGEEQKLKVLQQKVSILQEERQLLQAERRSSAAARSKLESLCRELQEHYSTLREETLHRCREDEEKRKEITCHFQDMLTEIQAQIELHSARNDKLCRENSNLTDKLESLMSQYEKREESLEKINKHQDLQHKLTEAKLQQANALLAEAEDKHKREKEYLLVQAAEWKLQAKTLTQQATVMQAQLTLYGQKFDEFQATLAKSNEIYVRFRKEMDNMTEKMKKVEKESNLWKTRFENCNKALTDMIEERTEKGKEYDLFVLKIQKLEKLCRALQEERCGLYDKIKEVCESSSNLPKKLSNLTANSEVSDPVLAPEEIQELEEEDPVLTENIARLRDEQAKLQELAASLLATPDDNEEEEKEELDLDEDVVVSAFIQFQTKTPVDLGLVPVPVQGEDKKPAAAKDEEVQSSSEAPKPEGRTSETIKMDPNPEGSEVQTQVQVREEKQAKSEEEVHQSVGATPEPENPKTELEPEASKAEVLEETGEVKAIRPVEEEKEPAQEPAEPTAPSDDQSKAADVAMKQVLKKKKKRSSRS